MEQPRSLLMLVLNQHYKDNPEIIETANRTIKEYTSVDICNYEKTLSKLYHLLNGLPSDILLYFLTLLPMPANQNSSSTLLSMMKQMHSSSFQQNMRPVLVQYLNDHIPALVPITNTLDNKIQPSTHDEIQSNANVISAIDEQIKNSKNKTRKAKCKVKVKPSNMSSLAQICANKIHVPSYQKRYKKIKNKAWKLVRSNKCNKEELSQCYAVLRDVNKKMKWLTVFESGIVPIDIIKDEYGSSDIFYQEKHFNNVISEELCDISETLKCSLKSFIEKC